MFGISNINYRLENSSFLLSHSIMESRYGNISKENVSIFYYPMSFCVCRIVEGFCAYLMLMPYIPLPN
ncbi:hypothetical protein XELAEV_18030509mg [Xenopus laevis]|uniref:Uncharacterized protein n=1 Tax=Xenopus laevis TaxID=8355 RepID=A0A974CMB4_XENLA|nr:hypothetical protein XELAEV_18030509mg [Xenopus laevis]